MTTQIHAGPVETYVERLGALGAGDRARLKRNAGRSLGEARDALGIFFRLLPPGIPPYEQSSYFLVGTLYPLGTPGGRGNLGETLRRARTKSNSAGIDRRVETLLDADQQQLGFRLRQAVRFAQSNRVPIDYVALLHDVLAWNHPGRWVQIRWAESYFGQSRD